MIARRLSRVIFRLWNVQEESITAQIEGLDVNFQISNDNFGCLIETLEWIYETQIVK